MADKKLGLALVLSAVDRASMVINKMANNAINKLDKLQNKSAALANKSFNAGKDLVTAGLAVGAPLYKMVDAATQFETKMVDIRKQISALDDPKELRLMEKQIMQLGKQLPIPIDQIQDLIAAGARMDIPREQLVQYTKDVTKMSIAFDITAGDIGESMGKIAKVFNQPVNAVSKMADAINYLDDNAISKGGDIIDVLQRIGGTARYLKFEQAAALTSTFLSLGESPERAASGINELIVTLSAASAQSKKAQGAFAAIGLNPKAVQKGFVTNAQGTILDVLQRINKVKPEQQNTILAQLFGQEHIGKIAKLANSYKEYERQLKLVNGQQKGSMDREYQKRIASTAAQMQLAKNNMQSTAILIGTTVLPAFNKLLVKVSGLANRINAFTQKHPVLVKWLVYTAAVFSALALAGGYLSFVVGGISRGFSIFMGVIKFVPKLIKGIQFALFALRYAMAFNPLTLWIAAGVALAAVVYLIIRNWDKIKRFFSMVWDSVKKAFWTGVKWIGKILGNFTPVGLIYTHWDKITAFFSKLWGKVKAIFIGYVTWVFGLGKMFFNAGANIVDSIWKGIKRMANKPVEAIKSIAKKMRDFLPFSPAKVGPLKDIHRIKLVETIAASIRPNAMIKAMNGTISRFVSDIRQPSPVPAAAMAGGGITFHYAPNITISGSATREDAHAIAQDGYNHFKRMMDRYIADQKRKSFGG